MSVIFDTLKTFVVVKEVNEDNVVAKLFHKATFAFLFLGAVLVASNQYIGDPIKCDKPRGHDIDMDFLTTSCWIHGSYHLPEWFVRNVTAESKSTAFCMRHQVRCRNLFLLSFILLLKIDDTPILIANYKQDRIKFGL